MLDLSKSKMEKFQGWISGLEPITSLSSKEELRKPLL